MNIKASPRRKSMRVLVVDDYPHMADLLANVLREKEYRAISVYSAEEALRTAEQFSPHALIADVKLPGMNGAELALAFAERFPACRAVLTTVDQWPQGILMGGRWIKVFQKPFEFTELCEFLDSAAPEAAGALSSSCSSLPLP